MFEIAVYQARRAAAMAHMGGGVAVVPAGVAGRKGRGHAPWRPLADFEWLTGFDEPGSVLVLSPDGAVASTLFVPEQDARAEQWEGRRLGPAGAVDALGVAAAYPLTELAARLPGLLRGAAPLWWGFGREPGLDAQLLAWWPALGDRRSPPPQTIRDPGAVLHALRLVKAPEELAAMRRAAALTAEGFAVARAAVRDGAGEHELEAALTGTWRRLGADGPAYAPIVAAGAHATVLHHVRADGVLRAGELVLVDAGASVGGYACDVTRTWAVGEPDARRAALHAAVLAAQAAAIAAVRPGAPVEAPQAAAEAVLTEAAARLGLAGPLADWFPHRVSHWIGLDVHDPGVAEVLVPGMVLTVEPGLYLPHEGIGVRIEDTVAVTATGCEVLTAGIPRTP